MLIDLPESISGRFLRIIPTECEVRCGLNFRILGCRLIDECEQYQDACDTNANCSDEDDGYRCICQPGFIGNGSECKGKQYFLPRLENYHVLRE